MKTRKRIWTDKEISLLIELYTPYAKKGDLQHKDWMQILQTIKSINPTRGLTSRNCRNKMSELLDQHAHELKLAANRWPWFMAVDKIVHIGDNKTKENATDITSQSLDAASTPNRCAATQFVNTNSMRESATRMPGNINIDMKKYQLWLEKLKDCRKSLDETISSANIMAGNDMLKLNEGEAETKYITTATFMQPIPKVEQGNERATEEALTDPLFIDFRADDPYMQLIDSLIGSPVDAFVHCENILVNNKNQPADDIDADKNKNIPRSTRSSTKRKFNDSSDDEPLAHKIKRGNGSHAT